MTTKTMLDEIDAQTRPRDGLTPPGGARDAALFSVGAFWDAESLFGSLEGVQSTLVGYTGGTSAQPTYRALGDHTETVLVGYDPAVIGYARLLEVFWRAHDPHKEPLGRQFMAAAWYLDREQRRLLRQSRDEVVRRLGHPVYTLSSPAGRFIEAESYHQKYFLKNEHKVWEALVEKCGDPASAALSTAAARLNAFFGGDLSPEKLLVMLESFEFDSETAQALKALAREKLDKGSKRSI